MNGSFDELRQLAEEYCRIIENVDEADSDWLRKVFRLLPQLHAAIALFL
jgi:hypothetical protein